MDAQSRIDELKYDYIRLQNDLEKRESTQQDTDPLIRQLHAIEDEIAQLRSSIRQKDV